MKSDFTAPVVLPSAGRFPYVTLAIVVLLVWVQEGRAQAPVSTSNSYFARTDSTQGYWRLKTDAAARSTHIQFYGKSHQLLYEEILPGKWIKLTRRRQKQFDRMLADLQAHQYVAYRLKINSLSAPPVPARPTNDSNFTLQKTSYQVNAHVDQKGMLYVAVNTPERLRYVIKLVDDRGTLLYEEAANHPQYRRRMDVSAVPKFQVIIQINNKRHVYEVDRPVMVGPFRIQPLTEPTSPARTEPPHEVPAPLAEDVL